MVFLSAMSMLIVPMSPMSAFSAQWCIYLWTCTGFHPFFHFSKAVLGASLFAPLFKAYNDSIFIKEGHADLLKWVSDAQSSKKLGKKDADGKSKLCSAVDIGIVQVLIAANSAVASADACTGFVGAGDFF